MTGVSQKCQYALRALFELCRRQGEGPIPVGQIAEDQSIPVRFLEVILGQLKQNGFVQSRRGVQGGYMVLRQPGEMLVGQVIRAIDGPMASMVDRNGTASAGASAAIPGALAFGSLWGRLEQAVSSVYDHTNFQDLLDDDMRMRQQYVSNYEI